MGRDRGLFIAGGGGTRVRREEVGVGPTVSRDGCEIRIVFNNFEKQLENIVGALEDELVWIPFCKYFIYLFTIFFFRKSWRRNYLEAPRYMMMRYPAPN